MLEKIARDIEMHRAHVRCYRTEEERAAAIEELAGIMAQATNWAARTVDPLDGDEHKYHPYILIVYSKSG